MTLLASLLAQIGAGFTPWKLACRVVATSPATLSGLYTLSGVALAEGDRVLCTAQAAGRDNGIWLASANAWTRAPDMSTSSYAQLGTTVRVLEGTGASEYRLTSPVTGTITVGVTSLTWAASGGGGPPLSGAAPQALGLVASAGVSNDAPRADHVHPHGNLSASGALHAAATTSINGFMSSADKTKLDASTSAATASALCQRDGSGRLSVTRLTADEVVGPTELAIGGAPLQLGAGSIEIAEAINGNQIAICTVAAAARVEVQDYCSSFTLDWQASAAGAGAATTIQGQRGAAGSAGGNLRLLAGEAGTTGTNTPGDVVVGLRTRQTSGGRTGRLRIEREGGTVLADIYQDSVGNTIWEGANIVFVTPSMVVNGTAFTLQGSSSIELTSPIVELSGQLSADANDVAFAATPTLDYNTSNHQRIGVLTGNITSLGASNLRDGAIYTVSVRQDGVGGRTITWSGSYAFGATYNGTPAAGANARTIWTFLSDGTTARCIGKETF